MTKKKNFIISGIVFIVVMLCCVFLFFGNKTPVQQDLSIIFSKTGNVSQYKTEGFSNPENGSTWTAAEVASVEIPLPEIAKDRFFYATLEASPFVAKRLKKQTVSVFVNDEFITDFTMTGLNVYKFDLPHDLQKLGKVANVKFKISNPTSPKSLGLSQDDRKLGMSVKKLTLSLGDANNPKSFAEYKLGDKIDFALNGNSSLYTADGWSNQENVLKWTDGKDAYMNLFVKNVKDKNLRLSVECSGLFAPSDKYQNVVVYVNDKELTSWKVSQFVSVYTAMIPSELIETGVVQIRFSMEKPFSPKTDKRKLGIAVRSVELSNRFGAKTKGRVASWLKSKITKSSDTAAEQK